MLTSSGIDLALCCSCYSGKGDACMDAALPELCKLVIHWWVDQRSILAKISPVLWIDISIIIVEMIMDSAN